MKKELGKISPKPTFPARELETWFRSEVKQLTESVRQLQKDFERVTVKPRSTKRPATPHAATTTTAKRRARPVRPGVAVARRARKI